MISSFIYTKYLMMLNPASRATAPITIRTNKMHVTQKVTTNLMSGPSEEIP